MEVKITTLQAQRINQQLKERDSFKKRELLKNTIKNGFLFGGFGAAIIAFEISCITLFGGNAMLAIISTFFMGGTWMLFFKSLLDVGLTDEHTHKYEILKGIRKKDDLFKNVKIDEAYIIKNRMV